MYLDLRQYKSIFYPLDSDLSSGQSHLLFEQPGPVDFPWLQFLPPLIDEKKIHLQLIYKGKLGFSDAKDKDLILELVKEEVSKVLGVSIYFNETEFAHIL